jgi:hypothetical protein
MRSPKALSAPMLEEAVDGAAVTAGCYEYSKAVAIMSALSPLE